jgi:hypothetical protein
MGAGHGTNPWRGAPALRGNAVQAVIPFANLPQKGVKNYVINDSGGAV